MVTFNRSVQYLRRNGQDVIALVTGIGILLFVRSYVSQEQPPSSAQIIQERPPGYREPALGNQIGAAAPRPDPEIPPPVAVHYPAQDFHIHPKLQRIYANKQDADDKRNVVLHNFPGMGTANLLQWNRVVNDAMSFRDRYGNIPVFDFMNYQHVLWDIHWQQHCHDLDTVFLSGMVNETFSEDPQSRYNRKMTTGGSSFSVAVEDEFGRKSFCPVADIENGQYRFLCRFGLLSCVNLDIRWHQASWNAFRGWSFDIDQKVHSYQYCKTKMIRSAHCVNPGEPLPGMRVRNPTRNVQEHHFDTDTLDHMYVTGDLGFEVDPADERQVNALCSFLGSFDQLSILGLDGKYAQCLSKQCSDVSLKVNLLQWGEEDPGSTIKNLTRDRERNLIIIHYGGDLLRSKGLEFGMEELPEELSSILPKLVEVDGSNVAFVSTESTPLVKESYVNRNILSALAERQKRLARETGLPFVDLFDLTNLFTEYARIENKVGNFVTLESGECSEVSRMFWIQLSNVLTAKEETVDVL